MTIEVKPGDDTDTEHVFSQRGNEAYVQPQSALRVKFGQKAEPNCPYRRKGNDLWYTHSLSLEDALSVSPVQIETLDYKPLVVSIDQTITPQLVHKVAGQGMPIKGKPGQRGDLFIKFNIVFPRELKTELRQQIIEVLGC